MENAIRSKHFRPGEGTTFEPGRTSTTFSSSAGDELNALPFIDSAPAQTNAAFQVGGPPGWWATDLEIAFEHRDRQISANPLPTTSRPRYRRGQQAVAWRRASYRSSNTTHTSGEAKSWPETRGAQGIVTGPGMRCEFVLPSPSSPNVLLPQQ